MNTEKFVNKMESVKEQPDFAAGEEVEEDLENMVPGDGGVKGLLNKFEKPPATGTSLANWAVGGVH